MVENHCYSAFYFVFITWNHSTLSIFKIKIVANKLSRIRYKLIQLFERLKCVLSIHVTTKKYVLVLAAEYLLKYKI